MRAQDFVAAALACEGVKWRHQGRNPAIALDCIGLLLHAGAVCGHDFGEIPPYGPDPLPEFMLEQVRRRADLVIGPRAAGDVLLIEWSRGVPQHLGIDIGDGRLINTSMHVRRVCVEPIDDAWQRRIHSRWRVHGMVA